MKTSAAITLYDVTRPTTYETALLWKEKVKTVIRQLGQDPLPVFLVANKIDCVGQFLFSPEVTAQFDGCFAVSVKEGKGLDDVVKFVVHKVLEEQKKLHTGPIDQRFPLEDW